MKMFMAMFFAAALIAACAAPALASPQPQYQSDQQMDRERNTQAYSDGYSQGQADARSHATRNDQPLSSRWTKDDDQRAWRQGYDAGYTNIVSGSSNAALPADLPHGDQQATQFGYQDGLAAGRHDAREGDKFKPEDHDLYKDGLHGWTVALGTKDQFKQLYREAWMKGYEQGFRGNGPR